MKEGVLVLIVWMAALAAAGKLPALGLNTDAVTVSGISAGGAMALQMSVAFSANVSGVGAIAGPPYDCSQGALTTAMLACMYNTMPVPLESMWAAVASASSNGLIDSASNLGGQRVWLYTGSQDSVVKSQVVRDGATFYRKYTSSVALVDSVPSEHAWITAAHGNSCGYLGSPYINNCDFDAAGDILKATLGRSNLTAPVSDASAAGSILQFSQDDFVSGGASSISFGPTGYMYVPDACKTTQCGLHIAFHGCQQTIADIGEEFITEAHLNEWAASNNLVVLYPQAQKSYLMPSNPEGCFDWWGYTTSNFLYKTGPQMQAVWSMVQTLTN